MLWRALGGGEARVCASVEEALAAARAFAAAGAGLGDTTHALVTGSLTSWARRSPRAGAGADDDGGDEGRV